MELTNLHEDMQEIDLLQDLDIYAPDYDQLYQLLFKGLERKHTILDIQYKGESFIFQQPLTRDDQQEQEELRHKFINLVITSLREDIKYSEEVMDPDAREKSFTLSWAPIYGLCCYLDDPHYYIQDIKSEEYEVATNAMPQDQLRVDIGYPAALLNDMVDQEKALEIKKKQWLAQGIPEHEVDAMVEFQGKIDTEMVKNQR